MHRVRPMHQLHTCAHAELHACAHAVSVVVLQVALYILTKPFDKVPDIAGELRMMDHNPAPTPTQSSLLWVAIAGILMLLDLSYAETQSPKPCVGYQHSPLSRMCCRNSCTEIWEALSWVLAFAPAHCCSSLCVHPANPLTCALPTP